MIRYLFLIAMLVVTGSTARSQSDSTGTVSFATVEVRPQFPGGETAMNNYIVKKVKYPAKAKQKGIQGRVYVGFTIEKDGSVADVSTLRGVDPLLDQEAERVIRSMPKWSPGTQDGKPVRVVFTIPINFTLK